MSIQFGHKPGVTSKLFFTFNIPVKKIGRRFQPFFIKNLQAQSHSTKKQSQGEIAKLFYVKNSTI
jgi:hypothetical protein